MSLQMKIILVGVLFLAGFLWSYLFLRQIMFNLRVASPLIKKMRTEQEDLIAVGAMRYTTLSTVVCSFISILLLGVTVYLCRNSWYYLAGFGLGAIISFVMLFRMVRPDSKPMFNSFCSGYYRFIPDDELRTAFYNQKAGPIRSRLRELGLSGEIIPKLSDN